MGEHVDLGDVDNVSISSIDAFRHMGSLDVRALILN